MKKSINTLIISSIGTFAAVSAVCLPMINARDSMVSAGGFMLALAILYLFTTIVIKEMTTIIKRSSAE